MKFWNRNYTLVVIGQIISLFANNILHFALTQCILDLTGSGLAYGFFTAVSMIPMVIFMPFGGVLADRVNKKRIMVSMDAVTGLVVFVLFPTLLGSTPIYFITLLLVVLSIIEAFYTPCVHASIPVLQAPEHLVRANSIVNQIGMTANIIGAVLGGIFYGFFGIAPVLIGCVICFLASAGLELFLVIPHTPPLTQGEGIWNTVKTDLKEGMAFVAKDEPAILQLIPSIAVLNFAITSMLTVAVPFLVRIRLGLSSQHVGLAMGLIAAAGVLGGFAAAWLADKVQVRALYQLLVMTGLSLVPVAIGFVVSTSEMLLFVLLIVCLMVSEVCCSIFSIFATTAIELKTPPHLLGKVMALLVSIGICAEPLGRGVYGLAFEFCRNHVSVVLLITAVFIVIFSFPTKKPLTKLDSGMGDVT